MIFDNKENLETYKYPFNWGVDYLDGTYLKEFEDNDSGNDFYSIQSKPIDKFGLFGCGMKMFYQQDGTFWLNGQMIQIEYHVDDKIYHLTSNFSQKDCITYKQAYVNINSNEINQKQKISEISFGYKTLLEYEEFDSKLNRKTTVQFYFQPIVLIPMRGKVYMEVKLTSNKDMNGQLMFKNKQKIVDEFDASLRKNYSGIIRWNIK